MSGKPDSTGIGTTYLQDKIKFLLSRFVNGLLPIRELIK
jgi:hypothetical protein